MSSKTDYYTLSVAYSCISVVMCISSGYQKVGQVSSGHVSGMLLMLFTLFQFLSLSSVVFVTYLTYLIVAV